MPLSRSLGLERPLGGFSYLVSSETSSSVDFELNCGMPLDRRHVAIIRATRLQNHPLAGRM